MSSCLVRFRAPAPWRSWQASTRASAVRTPTALVRMAGASSTRDAMGSAASGASRRMIDVTLTGRGTGWVASSSPKSDLCIAVFESVPVSAPAVAFTAATRSAAPAVGRAPDSSSSTGHTWLFQVACRCSQVGEPTSP